MRSPSAPTASTATTAAATTNVKRKRSHKRQKITVYDVVASRVNAEGFIKPAAFRSEVEEIRFRSGVARPADEVLGRRYRAPDNVAPVDEGKCSKLLPDNELMIAIHQYASDFYARNGIEISNVKSMDETALIAIGLLAEETVEHLLGDNGHLALVALEDDGLEDEI